MPYQRARREEARTTFWCPMKHFFLNFGEHLLLKHLVEALDRRLPALPRPLVLGLLAVDRADRRQRLGAGVILGDRGLLGQPIDPVAAFLSGYLIFWTVKTSSRTKKVWICRTSAALR
jgi:hypothetical protein